MKDRYNPRKTRGFQKKDPFSLGGKAALESEAAILVCIITTALSPTTKEAESS